MSVDAFALAGAGLAGTVLGAALTALLGDWRDRRREERLDAMAARSERKDRDLEALAQTRRRAHETVEQLRGLAVRPSNWKRSDRYELANDALIGDADVIRAYRELLVDLQTRFGLGLPTEALRRSVRVLASIDTAIASQGDRVRRGDPMVVISQDLAAELFDMDAFADRLISIDQPPTLQGRLGRFVIDALRLWTSIRRRGLVARGHRD